MYLFHCWKDFLKIAHHASNAYFLFCLCQLHNTSRGRNLFFPNQLYSLYPRELARSFLDLWLSDCHRIIHLFLWSPKNINQIKSFLHIITLKIPGNSVHSFDFRFSSPLYSFCHLTPNSFWSSSSYTTAPVPFIGQGIVSSSVMWGFEQGHQTQKNQNFNLSSTLYKYDIDQVKRLSFYSPNP